MQVPITSRLNKFGHKKSLLEQIHKMIMDFRWPFLHRNPIYQAKKLHIIIDHLMSKMTGLKCKAKCSNCCKQEVSVLGPEIELIKAYLKKYPTEFKEQGTACGFLHNEQCAIYSVRPATCRAMASRTNPINCIPQKKDKTDALNIPAEVIISGMALFHKVFTLRESFKRHGS